MATAQQRNYKNALVGLTFWNIKDEKTGLSNQYTSLNFLTEFAESDENLFGNDLQKLDTKKEYFHYLKSAGFQLRSPLPCSFEMGTARAAKRKSKPFALDIEFLGQEKPLSAQQYDSTKAMDIASQVLTDFIPHDELQGAMTMAEKAEYNLMDIRLIPLRIAFIEKYQFEDDNGNPVESASAYICSFNQGLNDENYIGMLTAKLSANPRLVPKLRGIVKPQEIRLKLFECIGVCYPKVGGKEADAMYLADIFYQGAFLLRGTAPLPTQKKSN